MIARAREAVQKHVFGHIDWFLFLAALSISLLGLFTMHSYAGGDTYFDKQVFWIGISVAVFFAATLVDYQFLSRT